jgi:hypothetical protein
MDYAKKMLGGYGNEKKESRYLAENNFMVKI